ncbi:hypothetical protein IAR55_005444 [Kwoniella newhampshirensis]|uniref:Uncharacterized protein n=1 Tax=Kwoniella newhampshirensis TaxID=1651941 RepID=A0AAW0YWA7_9TREE
MSMNTPIVKQINRVSKRDLGELIYLYLHTTPRDLTFSSALAAAIEDVVLGSVLLQITRYLPSFWRSDPIWALCGIVFGMMVCLGQFAMNLWQTHRLIDKAATALTEVVVADVKANMGVLTVIGLMNAVAAGYFAQRAWNMAGKKVWLACPLILGIFSSLGLSFGVAIKGLLLPSLAGEPSNARLMQYKDWLDTDNRLVVIWTAISLVKDILVCGLMTIMLLKSKDEIQQRERTLFRLLLRLTYETMFGPVAINVINLAVVVDQGATFAGYSRIVSWVLGPIYFSSILQSLNYRKDVQQILQVQPQRRQSHGMSSILKRSTEREPSPIPLSSIDLGHKGVLDRRQLRKSEEGCGSDKEVRLHYVTGHGSPRSNMATTADLEMRERSPSPDVSIVLGGEKGRRG